MPCHGMGQASTQVWLAGAPLKKMRILEGEIAATQFPLPSVSISVLSISETARSGVSPSARERVRVVVRFNYLLPSVALVTDVVRSLGFLGRARMSICFPAICTLFPLESEGNFIPLGLHSEAQCTDLRKLRSKIKDESRAPSPTSPVATS